MHSALRTQLNRFRVKTNYRDIKLTLNQYNPLKFIILSLAGLCFFAVGSLAYAAKAKSALPWYEIEVIIFLNQLELGVASETWEVDGPPAGDFRPIRLSLPGEIGPDISSAGYGNYAGNTNMNDPSQQMDDMAFGQASANSSNPSNNPYSQAFVLLKRDQFQLTNIFKKLTNSANYKPILHIAWRQPTLLPKKSQPVYIYTGMDQKQPEPVFQTQPRNQFSEPVVFGRSSADVANETFAGPQMQQLSGTIRVSVSRYLHIATDLHYRAPVWLRETVEVVDTNSGSNISSFFGVQPTNTTNMVVEREVITDFRLLETRRMRSTEIHYYDNPKFGVIVMATPYAIDGSDS